MQRVKADGAAVFAITLQDLIDENRKLEDGLKAWPERFPAFRGSEVWKAPFHAEIWCVARSEQPQALVELQSLVRGVREYVKRVIWYYQVVLKKEDELQLFQDCGRGHGLVDLEEPKLARSLPTRRSWVRLTSETLSGENIRVVLDEHWQLLVFEQKNQADEQKTQGSSKPSPEELSPDIQPEEKAGETGMQSVNSGRLAERRQAFCVPLLKQLGWSNSDWANAAKVEHGTVDDYLAGKTQPYRSTRKKLADALKVGVDQLPP